MSRFTTLAVLMVASTLAASTANPGSAHAEMPKVERTSERAPRFVEGDLDISNETSLEKYSDLEVVTGTLTIAGNTRLKNLDGLARLRAVGQLVISENLALTNVEGLSRLRHARSVTIHGNPRLETLRGLESLKKVDRLVLTENGIFFTTGLTGMKEVGELVVARNGRLLSLRGLSHLEVAESVTIVGNPRVAVHTGLMSDLRLVTGKLEIKRNAGIQATEIAALEQRIQAGVRLASR
jgi:hypothetical protein